MKTTNLHGILLFLLFISCGGDKKKEDVLRLVAEWQGKEIIFPKNIVFTRYLTDTTNFLIPESEYKVLIYVDSVGCTACKLQLSQWKELMAYTDSTSRGAVPFLFFIHSNNYWEMYYLLKEDNFDIPVCIDKEDELNKLNRFPSDTDFRTFLLDRENKIVVIGNPIQNLAVKELYLKRISGKNDSADIQIETSVAVDTSEIDMGTFGKSETKQAMFTLRNTGNSPLVIADVVVTCGCATIEFDKYPAAPSEVLKVVVNMTPKDSGFFSETITVKTNTKEYIKLIIRGQAS
ncbi:MAG: DUF1573 domain-containing protein [Tannerellaceae bacterium]|jgi:hypothetical protein|nr:DUF1573 domain-containing protein [Tannerellaceae bacterium]